MTSRPVSAMPSPSIDRAARAGYEIMRAFEYGVLDDNTLLPWHNAPDPMKEAVRSGVKTIVDQGPDSDHGQWADRGRGWFWIPRLGELSLCRADFVRGQLFTLVVRAVFEDVSGAL